MTEYMATPKTLADGLSPSRDPLLAMMDHPGETPCNGLHSGSPVRNLSV